MFQDNGVVLNATCMDRHDTVESFNREWDMWIGKGWIPRRDLGAANERIYDFLVRHEAHEVTYWSWDWAYYEEDPLEGLTEEEVTGKVQ